MPTYVKQNELQEPFSECDVCVISLFFSLFIRARLGGHEAEMGYRNCVETTSCTLNSWSGWSLMGKSQGERLKMICSDLNDWHTET